MTNLAIDLAVPAPRGNPTTQHGIGRVSGSRDRVLRRSATRLMYIPFTQQLCKLTAFYCKSRHRRAIGNSP